MLAVIVRAAERLDRPGAVTRLKRLTITAAQSGCRVVARNRKLPPNVCLDARAPR
jgi:hypothetical protein